jgi:dihydropteroate synthase
MGVLNVTPDSFSDGGRYTNTEAAVSAALQMVEAGADIIDIGGESTRPGAAPVCEAEELDRVIPVLNQLARHSDCILSVDTSKPGVIDAAAQAGAHMINDVRALTLPGALEAVLSTRVAVCLMHMRGEPQSMQINPSYVDVVSEVLEELSSRATIAVAAGIAAQRIVLDPGFGFGKSLDHNLSLLRQLSRFTELGYPILVGFSRKSMVGALTGRRTEERLAGSLALAILALQQGARLFRVHDVAATVDVLRVAQAVAG